MANWNFPVLWQKNFPSAQIYPTKLKFIKNAAHTKKNPKV